MNTKIKPLVSIISPCYNGDRYVNRMLESILNQTYPYIELICVDDGSTDKTGKIIESYYRRFADAGKTLSLIQQENQGQASAVNNALKTINGEYLAWIDCDDFITADSIERRVQVLEEHREFGTVTTGYYTVDEATIDKTISDHTNEFGSLSFQPNQFCLALTGRSIIHSHCQMIRVCNMMAINPKMQISTVKAGQNYQLLMPMYYFYKRAFIPEPLAYYVIRKDSHFHSERNDQEWIERLDDLIQMLAETFRIMKLPKWEAEKYIRMSYFYEEKMRRIDNYDGNN